MNKNLQKVIGVIMIMKDYGIMPNYSDLERQYGVDRHTIKKVYENGGMPPRKKRVGLSKWDPYYDEIVEFCNQGGCTKRAIHEYLKHKYGEEKLPGNYNSFKAYTNRRKIQIKKSEKDPHPLYETDKGAVLQADFKEDLKFTLTTGEVIEFNVFSATLGYSREHVFFYTKNKTRDDFLRCTIKAFRKLGGITETLLTDNAAAVVNHQTGKVLPEVSQFFKDIGVEFKTCKVRTPETKGKVLCGTLYYVEA